MTKEISVVDHYDTLKHVADLWIKGGNPTGISKELGIKRAEVLEYIEEWKGIARNDINIREQAQEVLQSTLQHYDLLTAEAWKLLDQADDKGNLAVKATAIKTIADMGKSKVEMLQKAGLYDDASLGDELAEMEEKQAILVGILKEVTADCEKCKFEVARRLTKVTGKVESVSPSIIVEGETIPAQ